MCTETFGIRRGAACADCGAGSGATCSDACPSRQALDAQRILDELDDELQPCCPSASYAAATLCGCQGRPS